MEYEVVRDIRYNPGHTELRFYDNDRLAASIDLRSGKAEFHGNYKPDAIAKIFWQCVAAKAPEALIGMRDWSTDFSNVPKGENVLVAIWNHDRSGTTTDIAILLFEPTDDDDDEVDDSDPSDRYRGIRGAHDGERGIWYWHDCEGYVSADEIAAWRPLPAPAMPTSS